MPVPLRGMIVLVGSRRLHVVMHLREHKKTRIHLANAPRPTRLTDFTQTPIFKEPNPHNENTRKRPEDLKHKKIGIKTPSEYHKKMHLIN